MAFRERDKRGQRDCADMKNALTVNIIQFETLNLGAVEESGMRRGQLVARPPRGGGSRLIDFKKRGAKNAAPIEIGAIKRAPKTIEHQQLDALDHITRNVLIAQT